VRTSYATFWASSGAPPKTLKVEDSRMLIFDPIHQKAPPKDDPAEPSEKSGGKEEPAPLPKEGPKVKVKALKEKLPSALGSEDCCSDSTVKLPHNDDAQANLEDWFVFTSRKTYLPFASHEVQASYADSANPDLPKDLFVRKGWVQKILIKGGHQVVVLFKSRIAIHDNLVTR